MSEIRNNILAEADEIIHGERNEQYGSAEDSFALIADYWNQYVSNKVIKIVRSYEDGHMNVLDWIGEDIVEAHDVSMMMILLKIARTDGTIKKKDNYVDIAGYAALAARM